MSQPFIIWTVRRTGGTTLTDLLMSLSKHPKTDHEPFNSGRALGAIADGWYAHKDVARTRANLLTALSDRPLVKHSFELHDDPLNRMILDVTKRLGYAQVTLTRQDEVARILSLELAKATGVWGKMGSEAGYADLRQGRTLLNFDIEAAVQHMETCHAHWRWLDIQMRVADLVPYRLHYEDIYADLAQGVRKVADLLTYLGFPTDSEQAHRNLIEDALRYKGQDSASLMPYVANVNEAKAALDARLAELRGGSIVMKEAAPQSHPLARSLRLNDA